MTDDKRKELLLKAKPILFNTEMVRAILDGKKTVTRRIIKPQPLMKLCYTFAGCDCRKWTYPDKNAYKYWGDEYKLICKIPEQEQKRIWTPPCHGDDILYVRETFYKTPDRYMYKANYSENEKFYIAGKEISMKWKPSIHMPKEAARIFLRVTGVSVERLQEITDDDIVRDFYLSEYSIRAVGRDYIAKEVWDSTIKKSDLAKYGWAANPWVWVIEFERID